MNKRLYKLNQSRQDMCAYWNYFKTNKHADNEHKKLRKFRLSYHMPRTQIIYDYLYNVFSWRIR